MRISEALASQRPFFSFEFFPPKTTPDRVSSLRRSKRSRRCARHSSPSPTGPAAHARAHGRACQGDSAAHRPHRRRARHLRRRRARRATRALRRFGASGDRERARATRRFAAGSARSYRWPYGFAHANELIAMLRRNYDFCIGAACYPEKHLEAATLRRRSRCAASASPMPARIFWSRNCSSTTRTTLRSTRQVRARDIALPILPGLMPITNFAQIQRFVAMCGATIPPKLHVEMRARKGRREGGRGSRRRVRRDAGARNCCKPGFRAFTFTRSTVRRQRGPSSRRCIAASAWRPACYRRDNTIVTTR